MFGIQWFLLLSGIGLILGILTDNQLWGLVIGAGVGWVIQYLIYIYKNGKKMKNE
jgi:hypothetical protein